MCVTGTCLANHAPSCTPRCAFAYTVISSVFLVYDFQMDQLSCMVVKPSWLHFRNSPRQRTTDVFPITRLPFITRTLGLCLLTVYGRYGIAGLKVLARSKFADEVELHLSSVEFPEACAEAYESTFHTDRGLRDVIIQTFRANPSLSLRPDVEMVVRETPGLAFELFRMASGLPVSS